MAGRFKWYGRQVSDDVNDELRKALAKAALIVQKEAKRNLSKPGKGKKHRGLNYRSSKPGDSPAVQTGHLRRSVQVDTSKLKGKRPSVRVGTNLKYGAWLEYGTRWIAMRPWFRPAVFKSQKKLAKLIEGRLRGVLKRGKR